MALIAPGICRFTINATFAGRNVANVLDMQVDTTGGTTPRSEAVSDIAGDILNNWSDHVIPRLVDDYVAQDVSWVDLDSAGGTTGSRSVTSTTTWPEAGPSVSAPLPGNVSVLVKKQVTGARGKRSGRMYLVGFSEGTTADTSANTIDSATRTTLDSYWALFLAGINDAEGPTLDVQRQLVVLHTRIPSVGADPEYNGYSAVSSLTTDETLATQRRRLR